MTRRKIALLTLVALAAFGPGAAQAACAPPTIEVEPAAARAGEQVTISGEGWLDGCQDHGSCSACGGCDYGPEPRPLQDIEIRIGRQDVTTVDADDSGAFRVRVTVPELPPAEYGVSGGIYDASYGPLPRLRILPKN